MGRRTGRSWCSKNRAEVKPVPPKEYALPLHVERHGTDGSPIVLLHGFGGSSFSWHYWIPALAANHQVWAVDLKAHGSAPAPEDDRYTPHDHAELICRLIIQQDLRNVTLFGHSMGGGIALLVALRLLERGRLERLVLVAGAAYAQRLPPFVKMACQGRLAAVFFTLTPKRVLIRWILRTIVYDPSAISGAQVEAYAEPLRSAAHRRGLIKTARDIIPPDLEQLSARFVEIDVPTLLMWGRHDRVVPLSVGERLLEELPNATLEVMEECGHLPPEEVPKDSLKIVESFLRGDVSSAPSQE
jgi:pimeloyl-ACP methyl ester carboxylesterase